MPIHNYFPLHIWDREFDSRLMAASFGALCNDGISFIGHEYNLSPMYTLSPYSFLWGGGVQRQASKVRLSWSSSISRNRGVVVNQNEEGVNNFPIINTRSTNNLNNCKLDLTKVSTIPELDEVPQAEYHSTFALGNIEYEQYLALCSTDNARSKMSNSLSIASSARFDSLGLLGQLYNERLASNLVSIFGDFVLILDNFYVESFGQNQIINRVDELKKGGWSQDRVDEFVSRRDSRIQLDIAARTEFATLVSKLASDNPHINFIFRPHPTKDPVFWLNSFASFRNISVIYNKSVYPWLLASICTIQSGCTTGLEATALGIPTFEISNLLPTRGPLLDNSIISNHINCPKDYVSLRSSVRDLFKQRRKSGFIGGISQVELQNIRDLAYNKSLSDSLIKIVEYNSNLVKNRLTKNLLIENIDYIFSDHSTLSSLLSLMKEQASLASISGSSLPSHSSSFDFASKNCGKLLHNPNKSRYIQFGEFKSRLKDIMHVLNCCTIEFPVFKCSQISHNLFSLYK